MYRLENDDGGVVFLIGIVKGLISEGERIENMVENIEFDVGALPISKGELEGLKDFIGSSEKPDFDLSTPEAAYARNLERYGDVSLPPPSYISLMRFCLKEEKEIEAVDMDEEHYTMTYCDCVSGVQWLWQSLKEKRLKRKDIEADGPREFAIKWDSTINSLSGYQELEEKREEVIYKNINRLSKRGTILGVVEVERLKGILQNSKDGGWKVEKVEPA